MAKQKEIYNQALEPFYQVQLGEGKKGEGLLADKAARKNKFLERLSKVKTNTEPLRGRGSTYAMSEYFKDRWTWGHSVSFTPTGLLIYLHFPGFYCQGIIN